MDIDALVNHLPVHESPAAERFYRLQIAREQAQGSDQAQRAPEMTRDDHIRIKTMREITNWPYWVIAAKYRAPDRPADQQRWTARQIQWACERPVTPKKMGSRKRILISAEDREKLKRFIDSDRKHREIPWPDIRFFLPGFDQFGIRAITTAMLSLGYKRQVRKRLIQLNATARRKRVEFAKWALERWPNEEDWISNEGPILWSDEVWATNAPMWKQWITIHECEDPESFALLRQKPHGWMFWGSFVGRRKGPCFFWEKEYGGITSEKYCRFILPLVQQFIHGYVDMHFQQDGAPAHRADATRLELATLQIPWIKWPPNSPDLNPIENVWHWMKHWIEMHYDLQRLNSVHLRSAIIAAWRAVPEDFLETLSRSMPKRLREVIRTDGKRVYY
jgi:transposase